MENYKTSKNTVIKTIKSPCVELILRFFIGVIFIYASIHKIVYPAQFAKIVYGYALFPPITINLIAIIVPYLELIMGSALILGIYTRAAAIISASLLFSFIIIISINMIRGHEFDCGCFTDNSKYLPHSTSMLLIRDIICFIIAIYITFYRKKRVKPVLCRIG